MQNHLADKSNLNGALIEFTTLAKIGDILLDYWFNENRVYGEVGGNK